MPKHKAAKSCVISPWLSAKADNKENRFTQMGNTFMLSKKVQSLSVGARWLYLSMAMESGGKREFTFKHSSAKKFGISSTSYDRFLKELKDSKFIEKIEDESLAQYAPGRYRFVFGWKGVSSKVAPHSGEGKGQNLPQLGEGMK